MNIIYCCQYCSSCSTEQFLMGITRTFWLNVTTPLPAVYLLACQESEFTKGNKESFQIRIHRNSMNSKLTALLHVFSPQFGSLPDK